MTRWTIADAPRDLLIEPNAGVYVVFVGGAAVYVGQSGNVKKRLCDLKYRREYGSSIKVFGERCFLPDETFKIKIKYAARRGEQLMLEARLIKRLQPRFNLAGLK